MRGWPILELIVVLLLVLPAAFFGWRLTERSRSYVQINASSTQLEKQSKTPEKLQHIYLELQTSRTPKYMQVTCNKKTFLYLENISDGQNFFTSNINLPSNERELTVVAEWEDGELPAAMRVQAEPDRAASSDETSWAKQGKLTYQLRWEQVK